MLLFMMICSLGWGIMLVLAAGAFISTVMTAAPASEQGKRGARAFYYAHLSFFPVVILCLIGAWVAYAVGAESLANLLLIVPFINVIVFGILLFSL